MYTNDPGGLLYFVDPLIAHVTNWMGQREIFWKKTCIYAYSWYEGEVYGNIATLKIDLPGGGGNRVTVHLIKDMFSFEGIPILGKIEREGLTDEVHLNISGIQEAKEMRRIIQDPIICEIGEIMRLNGKATFDFALTFVVCEGYKAVAHFMRIKGNKEVKLDITIPKDFEWSEGDLAEAYGSIFGSGSADETFAGEGLVSLTWKSPRIA